MENLYRNFFSNIYECEKLLLNFKGNEVDFSEYICEDGITSKEKPLEEYPTILAYDKNEDIKFLKVKKVMLNDNGDIVLYLEERDEYVSVDEALSFSANSVLTAVSEISNMLK